MLSVHRTHLYKIYSFESKLVKFSEPPPKFNMELCAQAAHRPEWKISSFINFGPPIFLS